MLVMKHAFAQPNKPDRKAAGTAGVGALRAVPRIDPAPGPRPMARAIAPIPRPRRLSAAPAEVPRVSRLVYRAGAVSVR